MATVSYNRGDLYGQVGLLEHRSDSTPIDTKVQREESFHPMNRYFAVLSLVVCCTLGMAVQASAAISRSTSGPVILEFERRSPETVVRSP